MQADRRPFERDLVLVGGGHAHVQVLRRWMMRPVPGVRLTLVVDLHDALYSGMVPGVVAGDYAAPELTIDVRPLARRAGARCIHAAVTRIDPVAQQLEVAGRAPLPYDVASLDVGSSVRDLDLPGVREASISTRPIGRFVPALERAIEGTEAGRPLRVAVVGAGPAGSELALCLDARLRRAGRRASITVFTMGDDLLPGVDSGLATRTRTEARRRDIEVRGGARVVSAEPGAVVLQGASDTTTEQRVGADLVVWATGAAPHRFLAESGLPTDAEGFVRVESTLQVEGHPALFAAGDCARLVDHPWVPRAGVYAVREGPILDRNLRSYLAGRSLRAYRPQRDFLALLNAGDRKAIGGKWGLGFQGEWVWRWKDWIDRRFMRRFQVLDAAGLPARDFPAPGAMAAGDEEMACGGCAAKVGPSPLHDALARLPAAPSDDAVRLGLAQADDAAAFETRKGDLLLTTVDAFRAFSDDAWLVGRVAAVNAMSDVQAKGGRARHALALVSVPDEGPRRSAETLFQVLAGIRAALDPLGVSLLGGHSTLGSELFVGLSISGELPGDGGWLPLGGAAPGDALVLTKPLGTGVLLAADMRGLATGRWMERATLRMLRDNAAAAEAAVAASAHACTDVSGFGLAGHLVEMLRHSGVGGELSLAALPALAGCETLMRAGLRSTYHAQNTTVGDAIGALPEGGEAWRRELLFDPQTSGGLLIAVASDAAPQLITRLHDQGDPEAAVVGHATAQAPGTPLVSLV